MEPDLCVRPFSVIIRNEPFATIIRIEIAIWNIWMLIPKFSLQKVTCRSTALSIATTNLGTLYNIIGIVFLLLMILCCWNVVPWYGNTKIFEKLCLWKCKKNIICWWELSPVLILSLEKVFNLILIKSYVWVNSLKPAFANFLAEAKGKWPKICCIRSGVAKIWLNNCTFHGVSDCLRFYFLIKWMDRINPKIGFPNFRGNLKSGSSFSEIK